MIYLDYAATTPVRPEVLAAMEPYFSGRAGNASSIHQFGRDAKSAVDAARRRIAGFVGCSAEEIVFTSGGTESTHTALLGAWLARPHRKHIITTAVEHHAVLHSTELLGELGIEVTTLPTDAFGRVFADELAAAVRPDTLLVSVMYVNNELGTVQAVNELAKAVKAVNADVLFHSDMVQAVSAAPIVLDDSDVDFASFSGHKVHGPKGVGALYLRKGTHWKPALRGGAQERNRRAGTENVPGIVGFGAAVDWLDSNWTTHLEIVQTRNKEFRTGLAEIGGISFNSPMDAAPQIINVRFHGVRADRLLMRLDLEGVAASAGSACTAGSLEPSHVLTACGLDPASVLESLRFSFSDMTTRDDIDQTLGILRRILPSLRG